MNYKKGAMELSVTAIVVLIIAIVMLGLALGFVRGMFGKVSTSFDEQISTEPEAPAPSGSEPITLSRETIITHAKDSEVLKVGVYNPTKNDWTGSGSGIAPSLSCSPTGVVTDANINNKSIAQGESENFNYLFTIGSVSDSTYLCKVNLTGIVGPDYIKDLTIRVTK